jgi:uncharacterized protein (AIM24 family)
MRPFGGESLFQNVYSVPADGTNATGEVCFASCFPGDAMYLPMDKDETWMLSRGAYLASSTNVKVSGKLNWRGLVRVGQDEGLVLPTVKCADGPGGLFVAAYGGFRAHVLAAGETLLVDNGMFLMCRKRSDGQPDYKLVKLGASFVSSFLGGEGIGMQFEGPGTVYTQSRNFNDFVAQIANRLPGGGGGGGGGGTAGPSLLDDAGDLISDGGGGGRRAQAARTAKKRVTAPSKKSRAAR